MKVGIPSLAEHPTMESELSTCPRMAKSILIYNTATEETENILVDHIPDKPCEHIPKLVERGVTDFVSGKCCKDHFDDFRTRGITVWKASPVVNIRDMINNFLLCGAWVADEAFFEEEIVIN